MADLATAKLFCRVDTSDDDAVVTAALAAATAHLESIGVDMETTPLPAPVEQAVLMLTAFFYDHRDDASAKPLGTIDRLITPYREVAL